MNHQMATAVHCPSDSFDDRVAECLRTCDLASLTRYYNELWQQRVELTNQLCEKVKFIASAEDARHFNKLEHRRFSKLADELRIVSDQCRILGATLHRARQGIWGEP